GGRRTEGLRELASERTALPTTGNRNPAKEVTDARTDPPHWRTTPAAHQRRTDHAHGAGPLCQQHGGAALRLGPAVGAVLPKRTDRTAARTAGAGGDPDERRSGDAGLPGEAVRRRTPRDRRAAVGADRAG